MKENLKEFSINDIQEVATEESDEFFYARICVLSTRPNTHKILITKEILERDGETVRGKWIVADPKYGESMSHTTTEVIVGIVPNDAKIDYITDEDGYTSMYVDAVLSKIYGKQVYDMFKKDNKRNVSVEMLTADLDEDEYGNTPIEALKICGITILGKLINGSCPNANMTVTKFSQEEAEQCYKKFAEEANYVSHPMKKDEYVDRDWDGEKAKHDAIKEKNFDTMAKSIFLKLDSDYKERKIGSLHYPVMGLYDGVWKYNANGLSSARTYGEQHDTSVADKAIAIQKKLGLYNKEDKMEDKKEFESVAEDENKEDIIMAEDEKEKEMSAEQPQEENKVEPKEDEQPQEKEMEEQPQKEQPQEEKEMGCGEKEMSESETDTQVEEQKDEEEKKFSMKDFTTLTFDEESEDIKAFAETVKEMSADEILSTIVELKKFQANRLSQDRDNKLNQIMASVKCDLDTKQFSELQEEGSKLSLDELGGFENKVKAFAYEATKNKIVQNDDGLMRFASGEQLQEQNHAELSADDIYNKYL